MMTDVLCGVDTWMDRRPQWVQNTIVFVVVISMATLLQCLCIAEQRHLVPPFEAAWEAISIPKTLREMSKNPPRFP